MSRYLSRILKYSPCSTESLLAILIYFERISVCSSLIFTSTSNLLQDTTNTSQTSSPVDCMQRQLSSTHINGSEERIISCDQHAIVIDSYSIHRLLITAALVSIKFLSDVFYTNLHVSSMSFSISVFY